MSKVDFSYEKFREYVKDKMSTIYEVDGSNKIITDTQPLQKFGKPTEGETLRYIYDNGLFNEMEEVITQAITPHKYREAYKKLNPSHDNLDDNIIQKGDYIKTGAGNNTLVLKIKDEDAILFTGREFIVAYGIQKEGDKAHWYWGKYYDELPEDVFERDKLKDEEKDEVKEPFNKNDFQKSLEEQIIELHKIIKEYEKINKDHSYDFRIKGLTEHIEVLDDLCYSNLVTEWKGALQEDQEEFFAEQTKLSKEYEDDWDLEP